jgi:hypothetical protein
LLFKQGATGPPFYLQDGGEKLKGFERGNVPLCFCNDINCKILHNSIFKGDHACRSAKILALQLWMSLSTQFMAPSTD